MMNKIIGVIAVAALVLSIVGLVGNQSGPKFGASSNFTNLSNLSLQDYGTSTLKILGGSSTTGACIQLNATSSATVLNMTFLASTTAPTNGSGVIATIAYGACN